MNDECIITNTKQKMGSSGRALLIQLYANWENFSDTTTVINL
jgi:hypothetical protein